MESDILMFQEIILPLIGMGFVLIASAGCYRLFSRAQERRHELRLTENSGGVGSDELRDLTGRIEVLEAHAGRVQELEERLDFAERLLTKGSRDPGQQ